MDLLRISLDGSAERLDPENTSFSPSTGEIYWYDIRGIEHDTERFLIEELALHPLIVDDALKEGVHTARFQPLDTCSLVLAHGINYLADSDLIEIAELGVLLGDKVIVSIHSTDLISIDELKQELLNSRHSLNSPQEMKHAILDRFVSNIRPAVDHMTDVMDDLEDAAINNPIPVVLEGIVRLKRSALRINRAMQRQIEVLHTLRSHYAQQDTALGIEFQDLAEKATRTFEINGILRERADSALAIYQGSVSLKQNETMKALAIIAAVFLPLSLVAGIYGMNFAYIPELSYRWGYHAILVAMAIFGVAVVWWIWLRPKISLWRIGKQSLYSMKVPVSLLNQGVRAANPKTNIRRRWR